MKILKLHIYNLASLEGQVEIDFTVPPLSTAGIFAITGPTGAGKSTILDALCLALYARTPRYMQAREQGVYVTDARGSSLSQNDPRGILRDGAAEGSAKVTFIGVDQQPYQASWQVRRARGKPDGNLLKPTVRLRNLRTGDDLPGKPTVLHQEIERLVGLNLEQFTRSVLLAQGDFTAFLKAGKDEKSALLEKLTGTEIYSDISLIIFNHFKAEEDKLNELRVRSSAVHLLTEPAIQEIQTLIQQAEINMEAAKVKQAICQKSLLWYQTAAALEGLTASATKLYQQALEKKEKSQPRQEKLQLVQAVQPTRTWADQWNAQQSIFKSKTAQYKELKETLVSLQQKQAADQSRLEIALKEVASLAAQKELLQPQVEAAKALDIQLLEKSKVHDRYTAHLENLNKKRLAQDQQNTGLLQNIDSLQALTANTKDWLTKNENRQPIAEHVQLILSKLQDAKEFLSEEEQGKRALETAIVKEAEITAALHKCQQKMQQFKEKVAQEKEKTTSLEAALSSSSLEELEAAQLTTVKCSQELMDGVSHWNQLTERRQALQIHQEKLLKRREQQTGNQARLQSLEPAVAQTLLLKTAARERLDNAKLIAARSVAQLREQLISDAPCPVCGSKEHPFAEHDPTSQRILASLLEEVTALENKYDQQLQDQRQLTVDNKYATEEINDLSSTITTTKLSVEKETVIWQGFSFYQQVKGILDHEISPWLNQALEQSQKKEKITGQNIKNFRDTKRLLEENNKTIQQLQESLNASKQSEAGLNSDLRSLQLSMSHDQKKVDRARQKLHQLKKEIGRYFPNESWQENWKNKPDTFQVSITEFAQQWATKVQESKDLESQLKSLTEKAADLRKQIEQQQETLSEWKQQTNAAQQDYSDSLQKRKELFGGTPVVDVERDMQSKWQYANQQEQAMEKEMAGHEKKIATCTIQIETLMEDISAANTQLTLFSDKLDNWLNSYHKTKSAPSKDLTRQDLLELLAMPDEWIQSEKAFISQINQQLDTAAGTLKNRKADLQQHQVRKTTEAALSDLQSEETSLKQVLDAHSAQKTEQLTLLKMDQEQKGRLTQLLAQMQAQEKVFENWAKLNTLLGSADGKKFRQIAQEYTLDTLLQYANQHLKTLSKRYVLQRIAGTLALQILDQDMGDEVRTVYSLSGGESFLVSLSLALGLASLSSNRLKVESLFIDEGFGSLDATTLNIAMDALERLHDQGRKVGVISHVQELTERIAVQIMVRKQPSGKSSIEILSI